MSNIGVLVILLSLRFGESKMVGNILNGLPGRIRDFPHAVHLVIKADAGMWSCGGSVVNQRVVLSAAHCVADCPPCDATAVVGDADIKAGTQVAVTASYVHEEWDDKSFRNDISLLFLGQDLAFSGTVKRVALVRSPPLFKKAHVAGWGLVTGRGEEKVETDILQTTDITLVSEKECEGFLQGTIPKTFCGNGIKISTVTCGDSGSGLMVDKYIEVGLVSCGIPDRSKTMAVFTNVSAFYDWIEIHSHDLYCKHRHA